MKNPKIAPTFHRRHSAPFSLPLHWSTWRTLRSALAQNHKSHCNPSRPQGCGGFVVREASKECFFFVSLIRANNGYATGRSHQSRLIVCWLFISWTRASVLTRLNVVGGGAVILVLQRFWQVDWGKNISLLRFVERSGRVWKWTLSNPCQIY